MLLDALLLGQALCGDDDRYLDLLICLIICAPSAY